MIENLAITNNNYKTWIDGPKVVVLSRLTEEWRPFQFVWRSVGGNIQIKIPKDFPKIRKRMGKNEAGLDISTAQPITFTQGSATSEPFEGNIRGEEAGHVYSLHVGEGQTATIDGTVEYITPNAGEFEFVFLDANGSVKGAEIVSVNQTWGDQWSFLNNTSAELEFLKLENLTPGQHFEVEYSLTATLSGP